MKVFYDINDFAAEIGLGRRQLRRYLEAEKVEPIRFPGRFGYPGSRYKWTREQIEAFKQRHPNLRPKP